MYGDTEVIRALARRVRHRGEELREEADVVLHAVGAVAWSGVAAEAMRVSARHQVRALRRCAALHDVAARALEQHATEVEHRKALIAAAERSFHHLLGAVRSLVAPPSGHRDWLGFDPPPAGVPGSETSLRAAS